MMSKKTVSGSLCNSIKEEKLLGGTFMNVGMKECLLRILCVKRSLCRSYSCTVPFYQKCFGKRKLYHSTCKSSSRNCHEVRLPIAEKWKSFARV